MKIGFTIFLAASLLVIVIGKPVVSQSSAEKSLSRWDAERQAVALLESQLAAHGQGIAPAQPNDIVQLESQWALRLAAPLGVPTHFAAFGPFESHYIRPEAASADKLTAVPDITFSEEFHSAAKHRRHPQYSIDPQSLPGQTVMAAPDRLRVDQAQSGYISVHAGGPDGPFLGFLATNKIVETRKEATKYSIAEPHLPVTQIDVADSPLRMCVAVGPLGEHLGPSKAAFHFARHAPTGNPEAGPRWVKELNAFIMTSVFSLNPKSSEITVHWTNPNGESPRTVIVVARGRVFYTGDVSVFKTTLNAGTHVVAFNWVEIRPEW